MQINSPTAPFGSRTLKLAHVAAQIAAREKPPEKAVHKWKIFRAVCTAKDKFMVGERALAVLDALLSFHPETTLCGEGLVVFPSNQQLMLRAHGMAPATLRRALAALVDVGLIIRRDSPNGKRYARRSREGGVDHAFGFDLAPLVARAEEIERLAAEISAEQLALRLTRERISLYRRDIAKMIAMGLEEGVPADWEAIHALYRGLVTRIPRTADRRTLEPLAGDLALLADEIASVLETHVKTQNKSCNESPDERHIQNSNPESSIDLEPAFQGSQGRKSEPKLEPEIPPSTKPPEVSRGQGKTPTQAYPLGMVLDACPDLFHYAKGGGRIANWREFLDVASLVRPMLGISPSAWEEAQAAMGELPAAIVVAAILQKGASVNSAGGYLRQLTRKAEAGEFTIGPMLMALIGGRKREKKRA
jgi:replication initiation protein RepC